jgi:putative transposase
MNTREIAKEYRLSHWAEVLRERSASGLSVKEFCKAAGIQENVYYYWQRKLREAACEELAARARREAVNPEKCLIPTGWALCKAEDSNSSKKSLAVEINGFRVHIESETDPELVAKVCRTLKSLC